MNYWHLGLDGNEVDHLTDVLLMINNYKILIIKSNLTFALKVVWDYFEHYVFIIFSC